MKMIRAIILVLVAYSLSYAQGPLVNVQTISTSGQIITVNTAALGAVKHSFTYTLATGTPSGISAVARCSQDYGRTYPFTFGTATSGTADTLKLTESCTNAQFTMSYSGNGSYTVTYLGAPSSLSNVLSQAGNPTVGQLAYFMAPGVLAGSGLTLDNASNILSGDVANLNGTRNATSFAGSDIGAKVNAAHTDLPSTGGVIHIKAGTYSFSTAITLTKPVMIECDPRTTTVLTWTGAGVAITNHVGDAYPYMNSGIRGCTLKGTSAVAAWGIKQIDTIGALYEDVTFQDFTGASGGALWVDNQVTFSERGRFINCNFSNNTNGIKFKNTSGINSFMYWTMLGTHFQTEPGQVGIYAQGNGVLNGVYLGKWNAFIASFNLTDLFSHVGAAPVFFKLDNGAAFTQGAGISITGEQTTGSGGKVFNIDATAYVDGAGAIETAPLGSTIVTVNSLSIGPRLNSQDGGIYTNNLRAANLTGDRQATFPDGTGTVMLGNGTNSVIDTATTSSYLTLKNAGVSGWAFGMGTAFASHGEIFSYTDNQDVFDATAGGDTKLASKSGDVDLNAAGTKGVVMGTATGIRTAVNGNSDNAGAITLSGGTGTYAFTRTYTVAPICVASDITASNSARPGVTVTTLTITGTGSDVVNYVCFPRL